MAWPFPHPPASRTDALERRLRALDRRLAVLVPGMSARDPRLPERPRTTFDPSLDRAGSEAHGQGPVSETANRACTAITERNGIWSLAVDGIWRGDYRKLAEAEAAAARATASHR